MKIKKQTEHVACVELYGNLILELHNLLSKAECEQLIAVANAKGWNRSSPSGGGHGRTGKEDARTNKFCVGENPQLANELWRRIRPFLRTNLAETGLPMNTYISQVTRGTEWTPVLVCERFRYYKYDEGDVFPEHVDYKLARTVVRLDPNTKQLKEYRQQSFFTLLIYLNDSFQHGETGYWPNHKGIHCRFLRDQELKPHQIVIRPRTGMGVIQEQNILHEGVAPTKGIKYILRTDIIHEKEIQRDARLKVRPTRAQVGDWERIFETSCKNYAD